MSSDDKEYKNLPNSFSTLMEQAKRTFLLREHAVLVKQATEDNARRSRLAQSFAHMTAQLNAEVQFVSRDQEEGGEEAAPSKEGASSEEGAGCN